MDELPFEKNARFRSHSNRIFRLFFKIVTHWLFQFFVTVVITLNTLCLAADSFNQSIEKEKFLKICNICFTWIFTFEMLCKLLGVGPKNYIKDSFNVFDSLIVLISLVDFILIETTPESNAKGVTNSFKAI